MVENLVTVAIMAVIAFEIIEHVLLPILWYLFKGRKKSDYNVVGMIGKTVEIKHWNDTTGTVLIHGEVWNALSDKPLKTGEIAIVREIDGLTLKLKPFVDNLNIY
jgi:membrane protein implicated in regulation of membrane protease activity